MKRNLDEVTKCARKRCRTPIEQHSAGRRRATCSNACRQSLHHDGLKVAAHAGHETAGRHHQRCSLSGCKVWIHG
jgi:hypothetical protein